MKNSVKCKGFCLHHFLFSFIFTVWISVDVLTYFQKFVLNLCCQKSNICCLNYSNPADLLKDLNWPRGWSGSEMTIKYDTEILNIESFLPSCRLQETFSSRVKEVVVFGVASMWGPIFNVDKTILSVPLVQSHLSSSRPANRVSNCSWVWMLFINEPNAAVASWKTVRAGTVRVWGPASVDDGSSFFGSRGFAETSGVWCEVGRSASGRRNWASRASTEG